MKKEYVSLEMDGTVCTVTINRPPANTLNKNLMAELTSVFTDLASRNNLRAVVLTGHGEKAFVAGADIAEVKDLSEAEGKVFSAQGQ